MYICYSDETGTEGKSTALTMVGIMADMTRYSRTAETFQGLSNACTKAARDGLSELKSVELYKGKGKWRG